jgi:putative sterol carrier protein
MLSITKRTDRAGSEKRMASGNAELIDKLRNSFAGRSLGAALQIDLGDHGKILIDGAEISSGGGEAATTLTTSAAVLRDICAGLTDAVQASYTGHARIKGSESTALRLSELLDPVGGPTNRIRRFSPGDSIEAIADALNSRGAVVIEDCVTRAVAEQVGCELRPHFDKFGDQYYADFEGFKTLRLSEILARSRTSAELIGDAFMLRVIDEILLPHCINYRIGSCTGIEIFPGEIAQVLHTDAGIYPIHIQGMELQVSAMWALSDFTMDNGATHVLPGSHHGPPRSAVTNASHAIQVPMATGSVLLYLGSVLHGGGANNTDLPRMGLVNTYALGWLRQEENHYLAIPREVANSYPERIRELMGYRSHGPILGTYPGS